MCAADESICKVSQQKVSVCYQVLTRVARNWLQKSHVMGYIQSAQTCFFFLTNQELNQNWPMVTWSKLVFPRLALVARFPFSSSSDWLIALLAFVVTG